jgi:hypothetical protein
MFINLLELASLATFGWFALMCAAFLESARSGLGRNRTR